MSVMCALAAKVGKVAEKRTKARPQPVIHRDYFLKRVLS